MGGSGGKHPKMSPAPSLREAEAPKAQQPEQSMAEAGLAAREEQLRRARAALGQEGTVLTSPFGTQEQAHEERNKGKTLLGA